MAKYTLIKNDLSSVIIEASNYRFGDAAVTFFDELNTPVYSISLAAVVTIEREGAVIRD